MKMRGGLRNIEQRTEVGFENTARETTQNAFHIMPTRPLAVLRAAEIQSDLLQR